MHVFFFFLLVAVSIRRDKLPKLLLMKIQCLALLVSKMSWQVPTHLPTLPITSTI